MLFKFLSVRMHLLDVFLLVCTLNIFEKAVGLQLQLYSPGALLAGQNGVAFGFNREPWSGH